MGGTIFGNPQKLYTVVHFTGMSLKLFIHYRGHFENGDNTGYNGRALHPYIVNDLDKWSYFEAVGFVKTLVTKKEFILW